MKKSLLPALSLLAIASQLSAQTLEEALDVNASQLTVTADGFQVTTTDTYDGEDAVEASLSNNEEATLVVSPQTLGVLSMQVKRTGNLRCYFEVQNGSSWDNLYELQSTTVFTDQQFILQPGSNYRLRTWSYYSSSTGNTVVDQLVFQPLEEGDLALAADTDLVLRNSDDRGIWISQTEDSLDGEDALKVAALRQPSEVETTIVGPALLSFAWKLNTPDYNDGLTLRIGESNSVSVRQATDQEGWATQEVLIPEGSHRLAWFYSISSYGSVAALSGEVLLDMISVTPLGEPDLNEALDSDAIQFKKGTAQDWFATGTGSSSDGEDAIGISSYSSGYSSSVVVDPVDAVIEGPAVIRFFWAANTSFSFNIGRTDGFGPDWGLAASISSSNSQWASAEAWVPPGAHHLRWQPHHGYSNNYISALLDSVAVAPIQTVSLQEALDSQGLVFHSGPAGYEWWGQTEEAFDFEDAAVSSFLPRYGQSWMQTVVDGPGTVTFKWRPRSPSSNYLDAKMYLLDGVLTPEGVTWSQVSQMPTSSSSSNWSEYSYTVPAGRHLITWLVERANTSENPPVNLYMVDRVRYNQQSTSSPLRASVKVDDWMWSPWLEWYFGYSGSWIYHPEHGNLYMTGESDSSVILYDPSLQSWCWTGEGAFPAFYRYSDSRWYSVDPGDGPGERWFYRMDDGEWIKEPQM